MADATPTGTTASSELKLPAHWLITGASSGLGRHLVDAHGARLVVERLDVSDADELGAFLHRILEDTNLSTSW
jgi:hypothetical protein